ncbi:hypothetical protein TRFO_28520 [Tritrichomonas foetus]|uniref:Ras-GAP domain-containing protein n=1 Tax=Tritrichomonas foetus TaxID=1144522 RepID=A0A1J4K2S2_9EUKA|nr:hypothetical protein TRFO_28520 [Tritrichomonas foetus]|eukprot:OHT04030.1 hypothetical protein TRFO_28520 [Tritrichomonas foetus]
MSEEQNHLLPFHLSRSYVLYGVEGLSSNVLDEDPVEPKEINETSRIFKFIESIKAQTDFSYLSLLHDIEKDHSDANEALYLKENSIGDKKDNANKSENQDSENGECLSNNEKSQEYTFKPTNSKERIHLLKEILSRVFTKKQIETCSAGRSRKALSLLSQYQRFILDATFAHFKRLMAKEFYATEELKVSFLKTVNSFFIPTKLDPPPLPRLAAPLLLTEGDFDVQLSKIVYTNVYSADKITVESVDILASANLKFINGDTIDDHVIKFTSATNPDKKFVFKYKYLNKQIWERILSPQTNQKQPYNVAQAVVDSCLAYGTAKALCPAAVTCMARVVASMNHVFLFSLFDVLSDNRDFLEPIFNCLLNFYAFHSKHLELLKFLCFYELRRTENTNEIFRQNNNFIRSINLFIKRVSTNYVNTTIKDLYYLIAKAPMWKLENPSDKDITTVTNLMRQFWTKMIETVDTIPPSIRSFCRYLKLLSEAMFRQQSLIHRAIFAVLLLRFVFVVLVSPADLGINVEDDPMSFTKVAQFTKILAFSAQFQPISGNENSPKRKLNPAIQASDDLVIQFYQELCKPVEADDVTVSQEDLGVSTIEFCSFVQKFQDKLLANSKGQNYTHIYVDEMIYEYTA